MKTLATLTVILALSACSKNSNAADERPRSGGWQQFGLAGDRLSFEMPGFADIAESVSGVGADLIREQIAKSEYDSRCFEIRVVSGPSLTKEPDETPAVWAKFFIADWISSDDDHRIEDEGEWSQGTLRGYWTKVGLPPQPGGRSVPVYVWLHAALWEGKAILAQFVATQAACTNDVYKGAVNRARERFLASVTVN